MVLCIAELYESGGREIVRRLSERMGMPYCDLEQDPNANASGAGIVLDSCARYEGSREDGYRVLLHSSVQYRAGQLAQGGSLSPEDAERQILRHDRERALQFGTKTGRKWPDYSGCDLAVDTEKLGVAATVELLVQFVALMTMHRRRREPASWGGSR